MNCEQAQQTIFDKTGIWGRLEARLHTWHCGSCRVMISENLRIATVLSHTPRPEPPAHLQQAWREMTGVPARAESTSASRMRPALAVLALLAIAGFTVLALRHHAPIAPKLTIAIPAGGPGIAVVIDPLLEADAGRYTAEWWPDGKSIAYTTFAKGEPRDYPKLLWRLNLTDMKMQLLVDARKLRVKQLPRFRYSPWVYFTYVSPNGKQIVFVGGQRLWIHDIAAGTTRPVPESFSALDGASWSPDGKSIAYSRIAGNDDMGTVDENRRGLWVWSPSDKLPHEIMPAPHDYSESQDNSDIMRPSWSPDGRWIAYILRKTLRDPRTHQSTEAIDEIWLIHPDGTGARPLVSLRGNSFPILLSTQCWSPDSKRIVFRNYSRSGGIVSVDIETGKMTTLVSKETLRTQLGKDMGFRSVPTWSPKSDHIAFGAARNGPQPGPNRTNIYVVAAKSGAIVPIVQTEDAANYEPAKWSPDGQALLYFRSFPEKPAPYVSVYPRSELWLVKLDVTDTAR
jgi:Tol biopolymer transport system component